ncbi:MAG TPA: sigma-54 dependent transcriptional regulator [Candidatus Binatia bacterium]|nr:sigma-54 dependent transcriptional regulator [Candidatus Binatia bacterium]
MKRVLVVDDDRRMRRTLQIVIEHMGLASAGAADPDEAREQLRTARFDLVLTDLKMPGTSGIELLEEIRADHPKLPVILITAYGTIQTAIEAMRKGASDYVLKPFDNDSLELVIRRALEHERFRSENVFLKEQVGETWAAEDLFLALPSMRAVAELIERVAPSTSPVLITGETGTGKELAARCIHAKSQRRETLFVPLNCAALPGELLEAELFGHARGAFTGADRDRQGKFEVAHGGTLFLDEIGDMPLSLQAKLLRVLEDAVVEPLGTNKRVCVDVRVISATNQNLEEAIAGKRFRSDLLDRLNTFEIHLSPLRERPDDVGILAPRLLDRFARELGKGKVRLSDDALELLRGYDWPGNVRELRNLMERAAVLSPEEVVTDRFFRSMIQVQQQAPPAKARAPLEEASSSDADLPLGDAVDRFERHLILRALDETHDNKAEAARRLAISERNLWYKLKKHGL